MATNPMHRKARNSFLLGMLIMLLISSIVIVFLVMQLMNKNKEEKEAEISMVNVCVLNQDVASGQEITSDMIETKAVSSDLVPTNATSDPNMFQKFYLQDNNGNTVKTVSSNGNTTMAITINNVDYPIQEDDATGNYYIQRNGQNEFIELNEVPMVANVDLKANTVLTVDLISAGETTTQTDIRRQEYNMIVLPIDLTTGDYVDIRLMLPNGQDYIVVAKKEVEIPDVGGSSSQDTIWVNLSEDEILHMSCAIIDAFRINGAKLYATKYTNPGMQNASPTYIINSDTSALLQNNPNILDEAMQKLRDRYASGAGLREYINSALDAQSDQADTNLQTNMEDSITRTQEERTDYLDSLATPATTTTTGTAGATTTTATE